MAADFFRRANSSSSSSTDRCDPLLVGLDVHSDHAEALQLMTKLCRFRFRYLKRSDHPGISGLLCGTVAPEETGSVLFGIARSSSSAWRSRSRADRRFSVCWHWFSAAQARSQALSFRAQCGDGLGVRRHQLFQRCGQRLLFKKLLRQLFFRKQLGHCGFQLLQLAVLSRRASCPSFVARELGLEPEARYQCEQRSGMPDALALPSNAEFAEGISGQLEMVVLARSIQLAVAPAVHFARAPTALRADGRCSSAQVAG